jgi:adenylyl- and sulfurtransferase ThiI
MDDGFAILILFAAVWFWWDSRGVAERASQLARQRCEQLGLVFLNDTVAWKKIRLKRNRQGRMQLQRTYFFEFASDMRQRYEGEIVMLGQQLTQLDLEAYRVDDY